MARNRYKWDSDALGVQLSALKRERDFLEQNKTFLQNMEGNVRANWISLAGNAYADNLEVDLENYTWILEKLSEKIETLEHILYAELPRGEDRIQAEVRSMCSRIG